VPPLVSVIIPARNAEKTIQNAIASVLEQTMPDLEIIVVDDASIDGTGEVVKGIQDPRLRLLRAEKNIREAAARNLGMREARGKWIAFLDADDEWAPRRLRHMLAATEGNENCFVTDLEVLAVPSSSGRLLPVAPACEPEDGQVLVSDFAELFSLRQDLRPMIPVRAFRGNGIQFPEWGSGGEWTYILSRLTACGVEGRVVRYPGYLYRALAAHDSSTLRAREELVNVLEYLVADTSLPEKSRQLLRERIKGVQVGLVATALRRRNFKKFFHYGSRHPRALLALPRRALLFPLAKARVTFAELVASRRASDLETGLVAARGFRPDEDSPVFCPTTSHTRATAPLVVISILNWNGWEDTIECLESILKLDYPNFLICLVDDCSTDGSVERLNAWATERVGPAALLINYSRATAIKGGEPETEAALDGADSRIRMVLIRNEQRLGAAGGRNVAVSYALHRSERADYVFFVDNDATVDPGSVSALLGACRQTEAGIVGAVLRHRTGRTWFAGTGSFLSQFFRPGRFLPPRAGVDYWPSPTVLAGAMLVRAEALDAIYRRRATYMNEKLFMGGEEQDFCMAAEKEGFGSVVAGKAIVYHGPTRKRANDRAPFHYYVNRNALMLAGDWLPLRWKVLFHLVFPLICMRRVVRFLAVKERRPLARAAFLGLIDGYAGRTGRWKYDKVDAAA